MYEKLAGGEKITSKMFIRILEKSLKQINNCMKSKLNVCRINKQL